MKVNLPVSTPFIGPLAMNNCRYLARFSGVSGGTIVKCELKGAGCFGGGERVVTGDESAIPSISGSGPATTRKKVS